MPEGKFTNVRSASTGGYPVQMRNLPQGQRRFASPLTPREVQARRQHRARVAGTFQGGGMSGNTQMSNQTSFFSPQLSTDFLELPQSLREKREIYRHFYNTDPIVGQSIDLHTELPLSKVRLATPKPRLAPEGFDSPESYGKYILWFFNQMCSRVKLFQRLIQAVHHYWLDGSVFIFAEDSDVDVPQDVGYEETSVGKKSVLKEDGETVEEDETGWVQREDREDRELAHYMKAYKGWDRLIILPIDQVKVTTYSFTDKLRIELIPSDRDRALIELAKMGNDPVALEMVEEIPEDVREFIAAGQLIPLGTDPNEGSFCYHMAGRRGAEEELGQSILDRCHLPGTQVTVKREGQVAQVPIEDLDPDMDLVLTSQGNWQEFEHGARLVDEAVTLLEVSKIEGQIACTADHKYPVLRDGSVVEIEAGTIEPGDHLQVAQIPLTETLGIVDFESFLDGTAEVYRARKSGNTSELTLRVIDGTQEHFTVQYTRGETDPRRLKRLADVSSILEWAAGLEAPVLKRSAELCEQFNLHPVTLKEIRYQLLAAHGYFPTVLRDKTLRFEPYLGDLPASPEVSLVKKFPRTLTLDSESGYFLGFWLGDGHITRQPGLDYGTLGITYGPNEAASLAALEVAVKPFLNKMGVAWSESPTASGVSLSGSQDVLVRWMATNFGHICEDKHLPDWIFEAPKGFLSGLLRGFVDSDGDVTHKRDGSVSVRLNNSNPVLMDQLFLLCTSLGIPASKTAPTAPRMVKQADGRLSLAKPMYAVHFTHGPSVRDFFESGFLAKRSDPDVWKDGRSGSRHRSHEGALYYRVKSVGTSHHKGPVYSLNVHTDHNFFAEKVNNFNCVRTLYYREKLRQAQTQIASRAMTPKRVVWAEDISEIDVEDLREQVDLALVDPDYSIVANYEVHWEEMGARDRLLDLSTEYEITDKQLHAGLGVTESLLSGETLYSGDRLKLEVINTRYLFLREIVQEYVEEHLFKPVARRKGFVEKNEWGEEDVIFPKLSFTRLPLRDSQDTYDALFNLYQKGSISIDLILEMFNIDPDDTRLKLEKDMFTVNDAMFNEVIRGIYGEVGRTLAEKTDVAQKIQEYLKLGDAAAEAPEEESRF